jgi:uncharacterized surface protein with fasciclin (FAS1) repeats
MLNKTKSHTIEKPRYNVPRKYLQIQTNTIMKKLVQSVTALAAAVLVTLGAAAQEKTVEVGGAPMYPSKNIVENAVNSKDHTTLVAAVKAAGLVETLQSDGPFTVFAPTNAAFAKLPKEAVANLLKPENKAALTSVLTYHVVAGKIDSKTLVGLIKKNGGKYTAKTVQGGEITFTLDGKKVVLTDANGNTSTVTIADVFQKNGVIHVVDTVVMPKM